MKFTLLILGLFVVIGSLNAQSNKDLKKDSLVIEENSRSFEYLIPEGLKQNPSLVFVLHGSGGDVPSTRMYTGYEFEKIASSRKNTIIVYPIGYDKHWNDCRKNASYKANQEDVNEIGFFNQMIDFFAEKHNINKEAVFVTGISNGGHMCYKLAYEMPEKIKGIAPFVANLPEDFNNDCTPKSVATSVLVINGTTDPINPYEGGWVVIQGDSTRGAVLSAQKTIEYWKNLLPCNTDAEITEYEDYAVEDESTVIGYQYFCEEANKKVRLLKVIGGGHTVPLKDTPPIPEQFKKVVGNKNLDINAPKMVLDFFESLNEAM